MKKLTKYTLPAVVAIVATATATAQNLSKEVVIEREIVPTERPAVRPSWVSPGVYAPKVTTKNLNPGEYTEAAELTRRVSILEPIAWNDTIAISPYRGYAAIGYFPAFNLGASAGYRFVQDSRTNAGTWLQYDGASWNGYDKEKNKTSLNTFSLGADLTRTFGAGRLSAEFGYDYGRSAYAPLLPDIDNGIQTMNNIGLRVGWEGSAAGGKVGYGVGANIGFTAFGRDRGIKAAPFDSEVVSDLTVSPLKETLFGFNASAKYKVGELSAWSLDIVSDFVRSSVTRELFPTKITGTDDAVTTLTESGASTLGDIALTPAYSFVYGDFSGRLGIRFDINTGHDKGVDVAPAINLGWTPSQFFGIALDATGGETLNKSAGLFAEVPWTLGVLPHGRTHVPVDARLALNFGQWNGFSASLFGGISHADDVLVPVMIDKTYSWASHSMTGCNYGIALGYRYKNLVNFTASAEGARHCEDYRRLDNAKWVFDLSVEVTPIEKLAIEAGWNVRTDRRFWSLYPALSAPANIPYWGGETVAAGDANNLRVGAKWAFTDSFTVFGRVENLLNHDWQLLPGLKSNGIHGAIGVELKF